MKINYFWFANSLWIFGKLKLMRLNWNLIWIYRCLSYAMRKWRIRIISSCGSFKCNCWWLVIALLFVFCPDRLRQYNKTFKKNSFHPWFVRWKSDSAMPNNRKKSMQYVSIQYFFFGASNGNKICWLRIQED